MSHVLDSSALIAYLQDEPGAPLVDGLLINEANTCFVHVVNLVEVYYHFLRTENEQGARRSIEDLVAAGITITRDLSDELWQEVARLKAAERISLADCFFLALARLLGATVVTADHHELDAVVSKALCTIQFIR